MNAFLLSALTATTLMTGGAVLAQQPSPPPPPPHTGFFDAMDRNKDGVVTRAEVTSILDQRFAAIDTDKNGVLSPAERKAAADAQREQRFNAHFDATDTDKNGQLSRDELRAAHGHGSKGSQPEAGGPAGREFHGKDRHRGGWRGFAPGGRGDAMGDVTKQDYMARALRQFDLLDSNDDGKITGAERDAVRPPMPRPEGRPAPTN